RLSGNLVDGQETPRSSCLVWQPLGSQAGSALEPGVSGRIVYKEPPPPAAPSVQADRDRREVAFAAQPRQGARAVALRFAAALARGASTAAASTREERRSLFLRDGDVIPCVVTGIDEQGVSFRTSLSSSTFVAHEKVKAVDLAPEAASTGTVKLTRSKRDR